MATLTGAFDTYEAIGNREDLSDVIYLISPTDTPFLTSVPKTKAKLTLHEWQTDALAAASGSNAVVEGEDVTITASTATVRRNNRTQISDKAPSVTGTQEAVLKAGRRSEMAYQVAKCAQELKRDMETSLLANTAKATGSTSVARVLGGVPTWIATNDVFASDGGSPTGDGSDTRTDGTQAALTEANLKSTIQNIWDAGGDPDCIMVGSKNKQTISGFTGNATRFKTAEDKKLVAAIDLYQSDFGDLQIIPNRFSRARDCLVLQKSMWAVAYLRPFRLYDLAKTGDHERRQLLVEYTLEARNEAASGGVFDCTT